MAVKKNVTSSSKLKSTPSKVKGITYRSSRQAEPSLQDESININQLKEDVEKERHSKNFFLITILITAMITALLTLGLTQEISPTLSDRTTLSAQKSGGVCLTEVELKKLIKEDNLRAYWTGPLKNATYTLNSSTKGQIFIRYVPKSEKCDDVAAKFRVIATYDEADAFATTQAAGTTADGVSLLNADGSIVYFNKNVPTNIYLAYPGIDYQIEIYDPNPKEAVTLATRAGILQMIKD